VACLEDKSMVRFGDAPPLAASLRNLAISLNGVAKTRSMVQALLIRRDRYATIGFLEARENGIFDAETLYYVLATLDASQIKLQMRSEPVD
jgi:hypothetical protein